MRTGALLHSWGSCCVRGCWSLSLAWNASCTGLASPIGLPIRAGTHNPVADPPVALGTVVHGCRAQPLWKCLLPLPLLLGVRQHCTSFTRRRWVTAGMHASGYVMTCTGVRYVVAGLSCSMKQDCCTRLGYTCFAALRHLLPLTQQLHSFTAADTLMASFFLRSSVRHPWPNSPAVHAREHLPYAVHAFEQSTKQTSHRVCVVMCCCRAAPKSA